MRKTYVAIVRDHSGSMRSLQKGAAADYNTVIDSIKNASIETDEDTYVTVVECGAGRDGLVKRVETNTSVHRMKPITNYNTEGNRTPLWDSMAEAIAVLSVLESIDKEDGAFLVMVITDGDDNSSKHTPSNIKQEIERLQRTDRWTFALRVPQGSARSMVALGIPQGNIIEWGQSEVALKKSTEATQQGISSFFKSRKAGTRSTNSFYANVADIPVAEIKNHLTDITSKVEVLQVPSYKDGAAISEFVTQQTGSYKLGHAMYELTKPETVQPQKSVAIRHKSTGKIYSGDTARQMLNLPAVGNVRLKVGMNGDYDIFIQSTSTNRKLVGGTSVLYIP
jgi:hypothetical protein